MVDPPSRIARQANILVTSVDSVCPSLFTVRASIRLNVLHTDFSKKTTFSIINALSTHHRHRLCPPTSFIRRKWGIQYRYSTVSMPPLAFSFPRADGPQPEAKFDADFHSKSRGAGMSTIPPSPLSCQQDLPKNAVS